MLKTLDFSRAFRVWAFLLPNYGAPGEILTLPHARSGFGSQAPLGPDSLPNPVRISYVDAKQKSHLTVASLFVINKQNSPTAKMA